MSIVKFFITYLLWIQFVNVTGVAIGNGVATAADTLCSQVYKVHVAYF